MKSWSPFQISLTGRAKGSFLGRGGVLKNTSNRALSVPDQAVDVVLGSAFTGGDFKDIGSTQQQFLSVPVCHHLPEQAYTVGDAGRG